MDQSSLSPALTQEQPLWSPSKERIEQTALYRFMRQMEDKTGERFPDYESFRLWSTHNMEMFWSDVWDFCGLVGDKGARVLPKGFTDEAKVEPGAVFFPDAALNFTENLLRKNDESKALVFRGEDKIETIVSWRELNEKVAQFARRLQALGIKKGDRVCGLMPNMPETIIAMLGAASIGAVWASASPDFGEQGILDRFGQIEPKVMIACAAYYYNGKSHDCLEKLRAVRSKLPSLESVVIVPYAADAPDLNGLESAVLYEDFIKDQDTAPLEFERFEFNHPLFIMFSSGTTGIPKCIVHGAGGTLLQNVKEMILQCDVKPGDALFYFTTCGWMMWNWLAIGLAVEATLLLYDGSPFYPKPDSLFDYADAYDMMMFGTSAKYVDALKKEGCSPAKSHKLEKLKILCSTGSPLMHESFDYIYSDIKSDLHVASIYGGTDILSASFGIGNPISPVYRGELQGPALGMAVDVFSDEGQSLAAGVQGELVCRKVFPSMPVSFWGDEGGKRYKGAYFETYNGVWHHGDWAEKTPHHGLIIHGRSDATLNPQGVRIGTAEIYRQVEQVDQVLESICVGQQWEGDVRVILFVRLKSGVTLDEALIKEIKTRIRKGASPRHVPAKILTVSDIPRTKSGKIVELAVRDVIHGRKVKNVEALANPEALDLYKDRSELAEG